MKNRASPCIWRGCAPAAANLPATGQTEQKQPLGGSPPRGRLLCEEKPQIRHRCTAGNGMGNCRLRDVILISNKGTSINRSI